MCARYTSYELPPLQKSVYARQLAPYVYTAHVWQQSGTRWLAPSRVSHTGATATSRATAIECTAAGPRVSFAQDVSRPSVYVKRVRARYNINMEEMDERT